MSFSLEAENITFDSKGDQLTLASGVVFGTANIASCIISLVTLIYITCKLKLNTYMKIILGITVGVNIISSILNTMVLVLFQIKGLFTIIECRMNVYSIIPLLATINMLNAISLLRYHMSHLATNARILKHWQAVVFIIAAIFTSYGFWILTLVYQEYFQFKSAVTICLREPHFPGKPMMPMLMLAKIIIFAIAGLKCDLSLFRLMKNRISDQNVGTQLVPWRSGSADNKEENDLHIPIRASILSSVFMLMASVLVALSLIVVLGSNQHVFVFWFVQSIIVVVSCGSPLALIIFTIKAQQKEKKSTSIAQPPNQLHFHEEEKQSTSNAQPPNQLHFHEEEKKSTSNAQPPNQLHFHEDRPNPRFKLNKKKQIQSEVPLQDLGMKNQIISRNVANVNVC